MGGGGTVRVTAERCEFSQREEVCEMRLSSIITLAAAAALGGCASAKVDYVQAAFSPVENSVNVSGTFDETWDKLIKRLSSDFFIINNVEKNSRIINVSFSSSTPEKYVTCGTTTRQYADGTKNITYSYDPAASTQYLSANDIGAFITLVRKTRLEGRANIYVEAISSNMNSVSTNIKYILTANVSVFNASDVNIGNSSFVFDFSTKNPSQPMHDGSALPPVVCHSTGTLEGMILSYATAP